jgi:RNA polymerase sigma factor (sigma-70 family)
MAEMEAPDSHVAVRSTAILTQVQWALYDFARGLVGEPELARDIVQDVFVDAWRAVKAGTPPFIGDLDEAGIRKWLFHMAYCRAAASMRRRYVISWESLDAAGDDGASELPWHDPVPFEDRVAEAELLREALLSLGPRGAACFLLSAVQGFTSAEIAQIVEIAPEAARKRLTRAKQRLRAAYMAAARDTRQQERTRR